MRRRGTFDVEDGVRADLLEDRDDVGEHNLIDQVDVGVWNVALDELEQRVFDFGLLHCDARLRHGFSLPHLW